MKHVCDVDDYHIDVKEISSKGMVRLGKYDEDHEKAEALVETLFSGNASEDDLEEISDWATQCAQTWKEKDSQKDRGFFKEIWEKMGRL